MTNQLYDTDGRRLSPIDRVIRYCIDNKFVVTMVTLVIIGWGIMVAPFDWDLGGLPRDPVPVDAIPDIGENQQIVFTEWRGRSPQDVEDQVTYPLTTALLGISGVKTIRSYSYFGFSSVYVIFDDGIDFYWSRSRVLEKLNSLPPGTIPSGVQPALGPDATALGQIFWYTLEGRDKDGNPTGGWDLHELRSIQDWTVRYALLSARGVAEVASAGGFVQEYQIDVNPEAMRAHNVALTDVFRAVKTSNIDVGARTIEINKAEYVIRGLGFIESISDIENTVIRQSENVPIRIADVGTVSLGPSLRRGALDKGGAEVVGGVVVVRYGENPLEAIKNVKKRIQEISAGLPRKTLPDGRVSQVTIIPFYDRTGLIHETLGTLNTALIDEILVTIIVVVIMMMNLRSSLLISGLLPLTVLIVFIAMKAFRVDANIVALSGIAIAIGTIVDMGIVISENIVKHLDRAPPEIPRRNVIFAAASEVGGAVLTAVATTVVSFLPVFTLEAAEGKLFKPLAYTKTFALVASIIVALTLVPPFAHLLFTKGQAAIRSRRMWRVGLLIAAAAAMYWSLWLTGFGLILVAAYLQFKSRIPTPIAARAPAMLNYIVVIIVAWVLASHWMPLGVRSGVILNFFFVVILLGSILVLVQLFIKGYEPILRWCLDHKFLFLVLPLVLVLVGTAVWLGFDRLFGFVPNFVRSTPAYVSLNHAFPGLGKEFMPDLDEGSFLYMPTTMPHASIGEALDVLQTQDKAFTSIPEIETVVGKLGRAESPLDPAPISMIETVINYKPEYIVGENGRRIKFKYNKKDGEFARDDHGELIPDDHGRPYRNWRDHIKTPTDIWDEIIKAGKLIGTTSAPKLQPIAARIVMLQSGMRAPLGVKIKGPDLETIEHIGLQIERFLKEVPSIEPAAVVADRIVGKPYLEIGIDREAIARYGISIQGVQDVIEVAIGGKRLTTTVEGRERYPVRVRYQRELRNSIEDLGNILVPAPDGTQIPLLELSEIRFVRGPMVIKSEDTFLVGYVIFDKRPGYAEVDVVEDAQKYLRGKINNGELDLPAGVSYAFAGSYESQIRSENRLTIVLPLALIIIFLILYFQFKHVPTTFLVFSGIFIAWSGGFLMIWLYSQDWFLNFSILGVDMRELFQIRNYNLSVAVWVGFLALFGIATDDGVIISTYLKQSFTHRKPSTVKAVRTATIEAGKRRVRPALMTAATTLLALIPVLTSTGRGSDIMVPMAIPSFGGMVFVVVRVLTVPVLYCWMAERHLKRSVGSPARSG
ncbi:MAG: efflux RND transporter permease subunit [Candidatus Latescibacterota bacterium]|nr:MAG: efflux RND transporter permease subunit [Candidatus Latescibacterota bacterium]